MKARVGAIPAALIVAQLVVGTVAGMASASDPTPPTPRLINPATGQYSEPLPCLSYGDFFRANPPGKVSNAELDVIMLRVYGKQAGVHSSGIPAAPDSHQAAIHPDHDGAFWTADRLRFESGLRDLNPRFSEAEVTRITGLAYAYYEHPESFPPHSSDCPGIAPATALLAKPGLRSDPDPESSALPVALSGFAAVVLIGGGAFAYRRRNHATGGNPT